MEDQQSRQIFVAWAQHGVKSAGRCGRGELNRGSDSGNLDVVWRVH
jgi:hypothetical protein